MASSTKVAFSDARLSECGQFRYALWRVWDQKKPLVCFICLNPSTADATTDDPTLRRCMDFARGWGHGGVVLGNLFAYRATNPKELAAVQDPIGQQNDRWLKRITRDADTIVAAWGHRGGYLDRDSAVMSMLPGMQCLGHTKKGHPRHPLYVKGTTRLVNL